MSIFAAAIIDGADDGQDAGGTFASNGTVITAGNNNTNHSSLRFQSATIAPGATINSAVIDLVAAVTGSNNTCNLRIRLDDSDDSAAIADHTDFAARTRTTAVTNWDAIAAWTAGDLIATPDFAAAVQEVVDRGGWASGGDMTVFIDDNTSSVGAIRHIAALENATYAESAIEIDYTEAAASGSIRNILLLGAG